MNDIEAKQIFDQVIRGHWESWPSGNEELLCWVKALQSFDFALARDAINELYESWKGERYPKMPVIMAAIQKYARTQHRAAPMAKLYQIEAEDGTLVWRPFWGHAHAARQELEPQAERLCKEADRMFPVDTHIICWFDPYKQESQGYCGADARELAFQSILDGPQTNTRAWLEKYLAAQKKAAERITMPRAAAIAAKKIEEPVTVGQVLDESIPF